MATKAFQERKKGHHTKKPYQKTRSKKRNSPGNPTNVIIVVDEWLRRNK